MVLSEQQTKSQLINPALEKAGWTLGMVDQEASTGRVNSEGEWSPGTADYVLYVEIDGEREVAVVLEAKTVSKSPKSGAKQAREYANSIGAPFAYATNGHEFVQVGPAGQIGRVRKLDDFPSPTKVRDAHPSELARKRKRQQEKERREKQRHERERRIQRVQEETARQDYEWAASKGYRWAASQAMDRLRRDETDHGDNRPSEANTIHSSAQHAKQRRGRRFREILKRLFAR